MIHLSNILLWLGGSDLQEEKKPLEGGLSKKEKGKGSKDSKGK